MPKTYTEQERAMIKKRLHETTADCMMRYGVKKTTVDMLVQKVQIPKGTFYLFYPSKESLMFEVLLELHEVIDTQLTSELKTLTKPTNVEQLTKTLCKYFKQAKGLAILQLMSSGEIELLAKKLPTTMLQEHFAQDTTMIEKIIQVLPKKHTVDAQLYSSAFRSIFMGMMSPQAMEEELFDAALELMVRGLVIQMMM